MVRQVLGIELTGLIVTSTIISAIVALSFQEILSGLFAGLVMQVEAPFTIGDWVEVAGQEGTIEQLNWRTVAILTRSSNYVIFTTNEFLIRQGDEGDSLLIIFSGMAGVFVEREADRVPVPT